MKVIFEKKSEYSEKNSSIVQRNKSVMSESGSFTSSMNLNPIIRYFELIEENGQDLNQLFVLREDNTSSSIYINLLQILIILF